MDTADIETQQKEKILIIYDECIFYSNNDKQEVWTNRKIIIT